ncbi:MAG: hypothetical protein RIT03_1151 [Bacteroidota bacterium]|jgi:hypothetical protein
MKKYLLLLLLLGLGMASAQKSAVPVGEQLVFTASYNMAGLLTQLAQVTLRTEMVSTSKKELLHLSCEAATYSKWDSFFKIRDSYETYVDPASLKPSLYKRDIFEGGYTKKEKYLFQKDGKTIASTVVKKKKPESKSTFAIKPGTQDIVSLIYKLRTVDFAHQSKQKITRFTAVFDEKELGVSVKYLGTERINAGVLGEKLCYKISIGAQTNALRGSDKNLIWLTADDQKIPCLIRFSIPVGTGQLVLTKQTKN